MVENVTLRRTVLRDADGTVHTVPSSEIKVVSNLTRDWTQVNLRVSVAYSADSDRVIELLKQDGTRISQKIPASANLIVAAAASARDRQSHRQHGGLSDLVKTKPAAQDAVRRELRRRIKASFEKNGIEPGDPNRLTIAQSAPSKFELASEA